jgi:hypothetical protein
MWEELKRPATLVAVILLIVSITAGVITSLYFYKKAERVGRISFRVDQVQVFDKNRIGQLPLKVINAAGQVIQENVYAANVAIWNSGNAEIATSSIRQPFKITLDGDLTPLDLTATSYSSSFEGFQISSDGTIAWQHFDPGHGFKLSIVYVSDALRRVRLKGSAVGIDDIQDVQELREQSEQIGRKSMWIFPVMVLAFLISIGFIRWGRRFWIRRLYTANTVLALIAMILWGYTIVRFYIVGELPYPPF